MMLDLKPVLRTGEASTISTYKLPYVVKESFSLWSELSCFMLCTRMKSSENLRWYGAIQKSTFVKQILSNFDMWNDVTSRL